MRRLLLVIIITICYTTSTAVNLAAAPAYYSGHAAPVIAMPQSPQPTVQLASTQTIRSAKSESWPAGTNLLSIPSIGLMAPIVAVGVTDTNEIDVPATRQVGYWIGSANFGAPGTTFLDGHVYGVFSQLNTVKAGQSITVTNNGQTYTYRVSHTETISLGDVSMGSLLHAYNASEGLVIMTCAGDYVPSMGTYDKRLVVYADRVN